MKEIIKGMLVVFLGVLLIFLLVWLGVKIFGGSGSKKIALPPEYTFSQCFDNDNVNFSQEYVDLRIEKAFKEAEQKYGNCSWKFGGRQDILGCTGDLFYLFECK